MEWFSVDKDGLRKLLARRGKHVVLRELLSNAWDQDVRRVDVLFQPPVRGLAQILVEDDDPEGFSDLAHAFTLFADSAKKANPEKRGRFNLGEKLVLALCEEAYVSTTKGTVHFDKVGRKVTSEKRPSGSVFCGVFRMTAEEARNVEKFFHTLIPPADVETYLNGAPLARRQPIAEVEMALPTVKADEDGQLSPTERKTRVVLYEPLPGEWASIYELGIPVVETGDRFHVQVNQKVPLSMERDNVTPSYLRKVRVVALNATYKLLTAEDANESWAREAAGEEGALEEAVKQVWGLRFGDKRVSYDPSDPEAVKLAVSQGYTVVTGKECSKAEWARAKSMGLISPAGAVTPSNSKVELSMNGEKPIPESEWTEGMYRMADFVQEVGSRLTGRNNIKVMIYNNAQAGVLAFYGHGRLGLNLGRLGKAFFDKPHSDPAVLSLLIHEFAHEDEGDHLSADYHDALCDMGARLVQVALEKPDVWKNEK